MVDERNNNTGIENEGQDINLYALFFKYMVYWPWFVASVLVCCIGMYIFLRYQTPVYNITSSVLIKEDEKKGGNAAANGLAAIQDLGMFSMSNNFDNEVEILKSRTLIKKVVNDMRLYISLEQKNIWGFNPPLYKNSPVDVFITPEEAERLVSPVILSMHYTKDGKLTVEAEYKIEKKGDAILLKQSFESLPAILPTPVGVFSFTSSDSIPELEDGKIDLVAQIYTPTATAKAYGEDLSVTPSSKTTTIAEIALKNTVEQRGTDFVNRLVAFYNQDANDEKNEVAQKTAEFIEERIAIINNELGTTENELAAFKQRSGLTNLTSDAQMALQESSRYEQRRMENATQISLVQYLRNYMNDPVNEDEVIPANVGLQDQNLTSVIDQYNTMLIERKRLLRTSSETNPVVRRLDSNIQDMRAGILTTIASVRKGLLITKADLDRQAGEYAGRIGNAPAQERRFVSIQRQQEIKAGLYLMLLQKREENNIALAATANNAKIIDDALADDFPVSPQSKKIYMMAFVLGLGIPVAIIYILNLLSYRIEGRADVERLTNVSIIGDVPLNDSEDKHAIAVRENDNDIMAETFRSLRTNLLFMLGDPDRKVILVTSTMSGEGKTFIASNLAVSLALLGKKVIIVGLDIRKPGLNKVFRIHHKEKGITGFLSAPQSTDLRSMILPSEVSDNLHVLPGGAIPPNPTELLARKSLDDAIELLKKDYDYVVLDTAPIGMVTDTQLIARVADISVYVCRADYTHKNDYQLINELYANKRLPGLCTVINGLDMKKKKYGYYYGYGKYGRYYGYGKKYGYGYGYGYGDTSDSK